ncbi:polysaccharide deacetylase family protein [Streptomyces sp. NPDC050560]|uniref:polysaccharide deacetylase family protein n=1 Tax=Streptomyces sp. NPDC050560 TaxID=3365630 RepID=UPI0037AAB1BC
MFRHARKHLRTAAATLTVAAAAFAATPAHATAQGPAGAGLWADCSGGYVGLTYDDGPNPSSTTALLNALNAGGAKATFFIWGEHAQQHLDLLRAEQSAGMWIGNHTWNHPHMTQIGEPAAYNQIADTQNIIQQTIGVRPTLFRPPYGETNAQIRNDELQLGLTSEVLWSVDSQDWNGASTQQIVQAAATLQPGGIILMHDGGYQTTIAAVPQILSNLSSRHLCPGQVNTVRDAATGQYRVTAVAP